MSHARQQIRDAVATAVTGLSITGANVSKTRMFRFENDECPALSVYTLSEEIERDTMKPSRLRLTAYRLKAPSSPIASL